MKVTEDLVQRFFSKIDYTSSCWNWNFSLDGKGYGQFEYQGKPKRAHRVSYELVKGKVPSGLDIDHLCRNIKCVNPDHLEAVTRSTNLKRGKLWQSKKTRCPNGHEYDYIDKRGARRCKRCLKSLAHTNYLKRKAQYA